MEFWLREKSHIAMIATADQDPFTQMIYLVFQNKILAFRNYARVTAVGRRLNNCVSGDDCGSVNNSLACFNAMWSTCMQYHTQLRNA